MNFKRIILLVFILGLFKTQAQQLASAYVGGDFTANKSGVFYQKNVLNTPHPESLAGQAMWSYNGTIYLFGGSSKDPSSTNFTVRANNRLWTYTPAAGWTLVSGSTGFATNYSPYVSGISSLVYGQKGVAASKNLPGARTGAATAQSPSGQLFMYGGFGLGYNSSGTKITGALEDLWMYNGSQWVSLMDSVSVAQSGVYGAQGQEGSSFTPGSRANATMWYQDGYLYLFGGASAVDNGWMGPTLRPTQNKNDLWRYNISTGQWSWISGSSGINAQATSSASVYTYPESKSGAAYVKGSDGNHYFYGGWTVTSSGVVVRSQTFWKFNGLNWSVLSGDPSNVSTANGSLSGGLTGATLAEANGNFYLIGGMISVNIFPFSYWANSTIYKWDGSAWSSYKTCASTYNNISSTEYSSTACLGSLVGEIKSVKLNDEIYLYGGLGLANEFSSLFSKFDGEDFAFVSTMGNTARNYRNGTASTISKPGGLYSAASAFNSASGELYMYGGDNQEAGLFSNLWKYSGGEWIWLTGAGASSSTLPVHGTQGVSATANTPGSRMGSVMWFNTAGDTLWLFGGYGYDSNGSLGRLNDLFCYVNGKWAWIKGSKLVNQTGVYGSQGVGSATNNPPGLSGMKVWVNSTGKAYMFGGVAQNTSGTLVSQNTLWKFTGTNWVWINGNNSSLPWYNIFGVPGDYQSYYTPSGRSNFCMAGDANGFFIFGGEGYFNTTALGNSNQLWHFDASLNQWSYMSGQLSSVTSAPVQSYGAATFNSSSVSPGYLRGATAWMVDGVFYVFGGRQHVGGSTYTNSNNLWEWNGSNWAWLKGAQNAFGYNQSPIYETAKDFDYDNLPAPRYNAISWKNGKTLYIAKGLGTANLTGDQSLDDIWAFNTGNIWNGTIWSNGTPSTKSENVQVLSATSPNTAFQAKSILIDANHSLDLNAQDISIAGDLFNYGALVNPGRIHFNRNGTSTIKGALLELDSILIVETQTTLNTNNYLKLKAASPSKFAELVNLGTVNGNVSMQYYIYLENTALNGRYVHFGNVFRDATLANLLAAADTTIRTGKSDPSINTVWYVDASNASWLSPAITDPFEPGRGYAVYAGTNASDRFLLKSGQSGVITLTGALPTTKNPSRAIHYNDGQSSSINWVGGTSQVATEGWNFLANPFTHSIKISDLLTNLSGKSIYLWNGSSYSAYNTFTDVSTSGGTPYLAPGQAFFVQLDQNDVLTNPNLTFNKETLWNAVGANRGRYFKNASTGADGIRVKLSTRDSIPLEDDAWVGFHQDASHAFDRKFDAWEIGLAEPGVSIPSLEGNLSIATFNPDSTYYVDLELLAIEGDTLNLDFNVADLKSFDQVYLEDLKFDIRQDLRIKATYSFVHDSAGIGRFRLKFAGRLGQRELPAVDKQISNYSFYNQGGKVFLSCLSDLSSKAEMNLRIYDLSGKLVQKLKWENLQEDLQILQNQNPGIYVLALEANNGAQELNENLKVFKLR